jgi:uncharacterized repeat protein (TIGR03803 family)
VKAKLTASGNGARIPAMNEPRSGRTPVLAMLVRLLWATALALPVFGLQGAVVLTTLYSFTGGEDGAYPSARLVQGRDGHLYGTISGFDPNNQATSSHGSVFKITTNGVLTTLYSFTGRKDGSYPWAGLVQGGDGDFYGTTFGSYGGPDYGTVFKINTNGLLASLYSFTGANDGANPSAGLTQGSDGNFYGTTQQGGTNASYWFSGGNGTVFKISTNGVLTSLYSFGSIVGAHGDALDGLRPVAGLVQGGDGNFYGTTESGGSNGFIYVPEAYTLTGYGTMFQISTNASLKTLYCFGPVSDGFDNPRDGAYPQATLVQGVDGDLYGTTADFDYRMIDGDLNATVFKISTNGAFTNLHSFAGGNGGAYPYPGLVQGSDGYFYGATSVSGDPILGRTGYGTIFRINADGALATLYSFSGGADGANPYSGLVEGSDGTFYGTTCEGGTNGFGTVFRLTVLPDPPQLTITPAGHNVVLMWQTNAVGFTLQSSTNLGSSAAWTTNSSVPHFANGQHAVTNAVSSTQMYYRLKH